MSKALSLANRISAVQTESGLDNEAFGRPFGADAATVVLWKTGIETPVHYILSAMCRQFDVDFFWLFTGENNTKSCQEQRIPDSLTSSVAHALCDCLAQDRRQLDLGDFSDLVEEIAAQLHSSGMTSATDQDVRRIIAEAR